VHLRVLAFEERVPVALLIRRAVDRYLRRGPKPSVVRQSIQHIADPGPKRSARKAVRR
jgi:hypothetical protein